MEWLAGRNAVHEMLRAQRRRVEKVILAEGAEVKGILADILNLSRQARIPVERAERFVLERLVGREHQGIIAQVSDYPYTSPEEIIALAHARQEPPFLLALDALQDPQNVGSLLRTAEAVGVHGVIIPERRAVGVTPAVSRASAGAVEHLCVAQVTNLARTLDALKAEGVWSVGVEEHPSARDYREADLNMPLVLVLGSEGEGMRRLVAEKCDLLVRIPMRGRINSLNVAVAGSLLLYQAWNARGGQ
jgi:23S rRNA (guanosine2251-2'-O)-methyltransferase